MLQPDEGLECFTGTFCWILNRWKSFKLLTSHRLEKSVVWLSSQPMKYLFSVVLLFSILFFSCTKNKELERDKQLIADYISEHNIENAVTTVSGLTYVIQTEGTGKNPTATSNVKVTYKGYLLDGTVFDSAITPITLNLQSVIQGWREGLSHFKEGGSGMLFIPADYGYGSTAKTNIPANSVLIFEIALIKVL